MASGIFITGTDTGVGKTLVSTALIKLLQSYNFKVAAMKPIAAGSEWIDKELKNADAIALQQAATLSIPYSTINPYALEPAIAPHLAADQAGINLDLAVIKQCYQTVQQQADIVIVEGAGGWEVPMNHTQTMADIPDDLNLSVVLVVGIRLGCLNHALLTQQAIQARNIPLIGWVANCIDPEMKNQRDNIHYLQQKIHAPLLAQLPYQSPVNYQQLVATFDKNAVDTFLLNAGLNPADI